MAWAGIVATARPLVGKNPLQAAVGLQLVAKVVAPFSPSQMVAGGGLAGAPVRGPIASSMGRERLEEAAERQQAIGIGQR